MRFNVNMYRVPVFQIRFNVNMYRFPVFKSGLMFICIDSLFSNRYEFLDD